MSEVLARIAANLDDLLWMMKMLNQEQLQTAIAQMTSHPIRKAISQVLDGDDFVNSMEVQKQVVALTNGTATRTVRDHLKALSDFGLLETKRDDQDSRSILYRKSRRWV